MAFAAAIGPVIGAISSLAGSVISFAASSAQAKQEQEIADFNAARKREEAALAQAKGAQDSAERKRQGDRAKALAVATNAQGGVATDTGTPLLLEQEFTAETDYRQNVVMNNAENNQRQLENRAKIDEYEGQVRSQATKAKGAASLVSGFAGAAKGIAGAFG